MNALEFKEVVISDLLSMVDDKIEMAKESIASINNSKSSATKSTAGDKHETGRAMMERELALSESQLSKTQLLKHSLLKISETKASEEVGVGTFVKADGIFFLIGVPFGAVIVNGEKCYAISSASPIGSQLLGKMVGHSFTFMGEKHEIKSIA